MAKAKGGTNPDPVLKPITAFDGARAFPHPEDRLREEWE